MTWKDPVQGTSSPLPFLSHPFYIFCVTRPPHPHHLLGQGGAGQAVIPRCPEGGPAPRSPRGRWAGRSWRQALGAAWRGPGRPGRKGVPLATEAGRQPDLPYHGTPGSCLFRPSYPEPSVEYDLLDPLGGGDRVDCGERHPAISRPSGSTAVSGWPVTLAGPCSAGICGLPTEPGGGSWWTTF